MIIVYLAQCCLIFQKKTSPLFIFFQKKTSWKIIAYKPLLIKHNERILGNFLKTIETLFRLFFMPWLLT